MPSSAPLAIASPDVKRRDERFRYIRLDRLILTANRFQRIPHAPSRQASLPAIRHLGLQDNLISEWRDIDSLNVWLPNLKTLSMNGNPILSRQCFRKSRYTAPISCAHGVMSAGSTDFRQQVIARLPYLEAFNGTPVRRIVFNSKTVRLIPYLLFLQIYLRYPSKKEPTARYIVSLK